VRELVWEEHTFADVEGHQVLSHQAAHAWVQAAKEMDRSHKDVRDSLRAKRRQTQLLLKEMNRPHKDADKIPQGRGQIPQGQIPQGCCEQDDGKGGCQCKNQP